MKRNTILVIAAALLPLSALAQVNPGLREDVIASGFVHKPLTIHEEKAFETAAIGKTVLRSEVLLDMESLEGWSHQGYGKVSLTSERSIDGSHSLRLAAPTMPEKMLDWGLGRGTCMATYDVGGADWRGYNRLRFQVYPSCEGARSIYLNLYLENDGEVKVPDPYGREGYHEINLKNNQWNDCFLEISGLSRDKVSSLKFAIEIFGRELTMGDSLVFDVDNVLLQEIAGPEAVLGWQPAPGRIVFSTTGYTREASKTAVTTLSGKTFEIVDNLTGRVVFKGDIKDTATALGEFRTLDFSALKDQGQYFIRVGDSSTWPFYIHDDIWEDSAWRLVNFLFCERCGYPVPGKHGACHTDLHADFDGKVYPLCGGWHDAGDMSQQSVQSGEIAYSLLQMAVTAKAKGSIELYNRLMEEALWGLDYILRGRLGGGFRAMNWGTNLWTDGILDTEDDAGRRRIDVHDGALENFLFAGIEAYAAGVIEDDPMLAENLRKVAVEDYGFAKARWDSLGFAELSQYGGRGHAGFSSESQYHANMSWAASQLYSLTGDPSYAADAAEAIRYALDCQRTEPVGNGLEGFFYRDKGRTGIVHYNHQSREYAYVEALAELLRTQPDAPEAARWLSAIKLYGSYLKATMRYIAPYGMAPAGVHHIDEIKDSAGFYINQIWVQKDLTEDFYEQMASAVDLGDGFRLRRFPVWFSFKGNTCVTLAAGKAAAICARVTGDPELKDMAEKQLQWVVGYNPFGQSLIYGEGSNYCQLYNALPGEMVGEIPVGMQSYYNGDEPYWPQFNTATYKEVWGSTASRWLMLVSEF